MCAPVPPPPPPANAIPNEEIKIPVSLYPDREFQFPVAPLAAPPATSTAMVRRPIHNGPPPDFSSTVAEKVPNKPEAKKNTPDIFATFGGCWDGNFANDVACTSDPNDCNNDTPFLSGLELNSLAYLSKPTVCTAQNIHTERSSFLGACIAGNGHGTSEASSEDANCSLVQDTTNEVSTLYGACQDKSSSMIYNCAWKADDCNDVGESYLAPEDLVEVLAANAGLAHNGKAHCDCSDVQIGACRSVITGNLMCAVDANQCAKEGEMFVSAKELREDPASYDHLLCQLCPDDAVDSKATQTFLDNIHKSQNQNQSISNSNNKEAFIIAGAVVGGVVGLLLLICCAMIAMRRCSHKKSRVIDLSTAPKESETAKDIESQEDTSTEQCSASDDPRPSGEFSTVAGIPANSTGDEK